MQKTESEDQSIDYTPKVLEEPNQGSDLQLEVDH